MIKRVQKILVLDGISGVPLGRDICDTLIELGISTIHFDCLKQTPRPFYPIRSALAKAHNRSGGRDTFVHLPRLIERTLERLMSLEQPSHILVVGFIYKFFSPRYLRQLADAYGACLLLYDTDSCNLYAKRREFVFFVENELPVYDRIFSFSAVTTRFFRDTRGLDALHLPFGAVPISLPVERPSSEVLFVGSGDLRRILLLEAIREHVTVRGNRWARNQALISDALQARIVDQPIWGEVLHGFLGGAKIVLNITRSDFFGAGTGVNLRIFEALAAGCFLMTDYCDEIADLFEIGVEIDTFRSSAELVEKVDYYLTNDLVRERVARRGYESFLKNHSWSVRVEQNLLPQLEF